MEKYIAYTLSIGEATNILQYRLDDKTIRLIKNLNFYEARSDNQYLDGSQIDDYIAQQFGVNKCEHWAMDGGMIVLIKE